MFFFDVGRKKERKKEKKKKRSVSLVTRRPLWWIDFFLNISFRRGKSTRKKIKQNLGSKKHTEKAKNPSLALGVKALGSSSRALRFGNRAQTATPHRSLERPHGKPREETFASFRSAPRSLVPSSHPLERTARRTSRSKKKNETTLRCTIELQRSLKNKKKAVEKIDVSKSSPRRCDATRRTWTLVALRPATDAIC